MNNQHSELRCTQCKREMNPNWIKLLHATINGAIKGAFRSTLHVHPVALPDHWRASFTKRAVGEIVNRIWELERGLCSLKGQLYVKHDEPEEASPPESPIGETERVAIPKQSQDG